MEACWSAPQKLRWRPEAKAGATSKGAIPIKTDLAAISGQATTGASEQFSGDKTVAQWFVASMSPELLALFTSLEGYVSSLGNDFSRQDLKLYIGPTIDHAPPHDRRASSMEGGGLLGALGALGPVPFRSPTGVRAGDTRLPVGVSAVGTKPAPLMNSGSAC